jgi:hypothetical protein
LSVAWCVLLVLDVNGRDSRPSPRWTQRRGAIARTSFFVLYSVFKERPAPVGREPCSSGHALQPKRWCRRFLGAARRSCADGASAARSEDPI